jgi:hypothetical protein
MAKTRVVVDLSQFGIKGVGNITVEGVEEVVNGMGIDKFGQRSEEEREQLRQILETINKQNLTLQNMPSNIQADLEMYDKKIKAIEKRIQDPVGSYLQQVKEEAEAGPGLGDALTAATQFNIPRTYEGVINYAQKKLIPDQPKQRMGDLAVIGSDIASFMLLRKNNLAKSRIDNALLSNAVKDNPAAAAGVILGANVWARGASNEAYNLMNDFARYMNDIPDPEQAMKNNEQLRDLTEMYNELLWSGGAVGLSNIYPYIKHAWGKKLLGVTEESKKMMKDASRMGVPMNVFTVSDAAVVKGAGKVVGLFPFVATKARQAQNAQQIAIANSVNKTLNDLSPINLLAEAGLLADQGFRESVSSLATSKALFYESAMEVTDTLLKNEKFIPTQHIKETAAKLSQRLGKDVSQIKLDYIKPGGGYAETIELDELLSQVKTMEQGQALNDILPGLQFLKDDYLSGRQFLKLQSALNDILRSGEKLDLGAPTMQRVKNFTTAMTTTINDFDNFKKLEDPAKEQFKGLFVNKFNASNRFMMEHEDMLRQRAAQIISLVDPNATKVGAEQAYGFSTPDMLAEMLLDSRSMKAPVAIREMREALGTTEVVIDGVKQTIDVFDAVANSILDDKIRGATRYISGQVPTGGNLIGGSQKRGMLDTLKATANIIPGVNIGSKEAATEFGVTATKNFNIPIMDIDKMKNIFGMTDPNKALGMQEILGMERWKKMRDVLDLAEGVQQTNFGDVSEFVKRRGFLGGANAITNLVTGGAILSNPFASIGLMAMARYGMSTLADPKFLDGVATLMNPDIKTLAKRNAMITLGRMYWDDERSEQIDNLPPELIEDFDGGNPMDVLQYLLFSQNQNLFPGSERMHIETDANGYATGVEITKTDSQPVFSEDGQEVGMKGQIDQVEEQNITQNPVSETTADPFLDVDFQSMNEVVPAAGAVPSQTLTQEQRIALAGGDLDEAIAMGNRRV